MISQPSPPPTPDFYSCFALKYRRHREMSKYMLQISGNTLFVTVHFTVNILFLYTDIMEYQMLFHFSLKLFSLQTTLNQCVTPYFRIFLKAEIKIDQSFWDITYNGKIRQAQIFSWQD